MNINNGKYYVVINRKEELLQRCRLKEALNRATHFLRHVSYHVLYLHQSSLFSIYLSFIIFLYVYIEPMSQYVDDFYLKHTLN